MPQPLPIAPISDLRRSQLGQVGRIPVLTEREVRTWRVAVESGGGRAHLSTGHSKVYELMRLRQLRSVKIGASRRIPQAALGGSLPGLRPDGRRIRKKVGGATKGEVLRSCVRDVRAELNAGLSVADNRLTVAAFLDRCLPGQVSEKTLDSYADTVRLHLTPSLGRKVLRRLTVSDVDQLLAWKRNAGYSANTVRIIEQYFAAL